MKRRFLIIPFLFFILDFTVSAQFIENRGQVFDVAQNPRPEVLYYYGVNGNVMYFEKTRIVCVFAKYETTDLSVFEGNQNAIDSINQTLGKTIERLDIEFIGSNKFCEVTYGDAHKHVTNFHLNGRENITGIHTYSSVTYHNIWDKIDITFYETSEGLKYDIFLNEGANLNDIQIRYNGATHLEIQDNNLIINTLQNKMSEKLPYSYRNGDSQQSVDVHYVINGDIISFRTSDSFQSLVIDPILVWATFFETATSGGNLDYDHNIADSDGNLYVYGLCDNSANNYPLVNPGGTAYQQTATSNDIYIAKFNQNRVLVWATYFGGSTDLDWSLGTEVLAIYGTTLHIVGDQLSSNSPHVNGGGFYYNAGSTRPFWARFNKDTGTLLHSTNIGGHTSSHPSIAISSTGLVAIVYHSYNWATVHLMNRAGAYNQAVNGGFTDMFLMLLNTAYTQTWGTWLGGPGTQEDCHVTFDNSNNIFYVSEVSWMSGSTAANEHLVNPGGGAYYQSVNASEDIMIGKFSASGALLWNTLYGGSAYDGIDSRMGNGSRVMIRPTTNELLVIGGTNSNNLPLQILAGAYNITAPSNINPAGGSFSDFGSFILKFSNTGVRNWATYWGGDPNNGDLLYDAKFVACDKFILAARAYYNPISYPGFYNQAIGQQSFLMQMDGNFTAEWSSYIGINTSVPKIAYTPYQTRLYLTTQTYSQLETTLDPGGGAYFDNSFTGPHYAAYYITEFTISMPPPPVTGPTDVCEGQTGAVYSVTPVAGATYNWTVPAGATIVSGQGTSSITVNFGSSGGQVCVTITAPCVQNTPSCITVNMPTPGGPGLWTWTGGFSTNWFYGCNWDKQTVPTLDADVLIPGGTPFQPTITGATGHCRTIEINSTNGAILNIEQTLSGMLQVHQ